jgi:uncharacterized membrane protein
VSRARKGSGTPLRYRVGVALAFAIGYVAGVITDSPLAAGASIFMLVFAVMYFARRAHRRTRLP